MINFKINIDGIDYSVSALEDFNNVYSIVSNEKRTLFGKNSKSGLWKLSNDQIQMPSSHLEKIKQEIESYFNTSN